MYPLVLLFISVAMMIESSMSLAIPRSIKHSPLGAFSSSYVSVPELAFYSVFITGKPFRPSVVASTLNCLPLRQLYSSPSSGRSSCQFSATRGLRPSSISSGVRPVIPIRVAPPLSLISVLVHHPQAVPHCTMLSVASLFSFHSHPLLLMEPAGLPPRAAFQHAEEG